jgi:excisionase family DNA binding protein
MYNRDKRGRFMRVNRMLTIEEAAQLLGYSITTVNRHLRKGLIRKVQVRKGYRVFIPQSEILRIKAGIIGSE